MYKSGFSFGDFLTANMVTCVIVLVLFFMYVEVYEVQGTSIRVHYFDEPSKEFSADEPMGKAVAYQSAQVDERVFSADPELLVSVDQDRLIEVDFETWMAVNRGSLILYIERLNKTILVLQME